MVIFVYSLWTAWIQYRPQRTVPDSKRQALAADASKSILKTLLEHRGSKKTLAIFPFAGDTGNLFSDAVHNTILSSGTFELQDKSLFDKARNLLNMEQYRSNDRQEALEFGKASDLVLYGTVERFETVDEKATLRVHYTLVDVAVKTDLADKTYVSDSPESTDLFNTIKGGAKNLFKANGSAQANLNRLFGWILAVLLLPVFTIKFLMVMTAKNSNRINAVILVFYTVLDILLAWILISPTSYGYALGILFLFLTFGAFVYNAKIMSIALRQTE
ncbi:MAG: hypothetical protein Q4G69_14745 [Planctomycetia bacterium]|nr:hypothetical protein [Planctomycetia bacterium]